MEVHEILGNGFQACLPKGSVACRQEVIYQRALAKEMSLQNLSFIREKEMPIFYKGEQLGTRRVDFLVEETISVEIKATIKLEDVHLTQAINLFKTKKQGFQPCFFVFF
jgi:GxxExxY protein